MTSASWKNEITTPDEPCKYCGQKCWFVGHFVDAGGHPKYPFVCFLCGRRSQRYAKRKVVERSGVTPVELHPQIPPFVCEVCGEQGAQEHHWAPTHIFGDDADIWPKSFLCTRHHELWHKLVTPNMGKT